MSNENWDPDNKVKYIFHITSGQRRRLKVVSAQRGETMSAVAATALENYLNEIEAGSLVGA